MSAEFHDMEFNFDGDLHEVEGLLDATAQVGIAHPWSTRDRLGLSDSEFPFRVDVYLSCSPALGTVLSTEPNARSAELVLVANVLYAHSRSPGTWVFYSRDRNHYAEQTRRYVPEYYTYRRIIDAVSTLERLGLIEHRRTRPSPSAKYRSRVRATDHLLELLDSIEVSREPGELIILRGKEHQLLDYRETDHTYAMRRDVLEHNEFLSDLDIAHPLAHADARGFLRIGERCLDLRRRRLYRVFNGSWTRGGRWYGGWWQNLPKKLRGDLLINGERVVEHDYRACHLRLLCARAGIDPPFHDPSFDPYAIDGFDRSHVKLAINVLLHAASPSAALGAVAHQLLGWGLQVPYCADLLITAVRMHFPDLERYWFSCIGLRLQGIDAEICRRVQRHLRRSGIPVLSVHDSFIVPVSFEETLANVMEEEMCRHARSLRLKR